MLAAEEGAVEIDSEHAFPGGEVELFDRTERDDSSGINQPVELAMLPSNFFSDPLPVGLGSYVERGIDTGAPGEVGRDHHAARVLDRRHHGAADGARGAGDQHYLVLEISHLLAICSCALRFVRWQQMAETNNLDVKKMPFERAIEELESIVKRLEEGKVPLEESVAIYERGQALKRRCEDLLRQAEARVEKITLDSSGAPTGSEPLDVD